MTPALLLAGLLTMSGYQDLPDLSIRPTAALRADVLRRRAAPGFEPGDLPPEPQDEDEGGRPDPRAWSAWDKALQAAMAGVSTYDAYDTNRFLRGHPNHVERNPLLGTRPSAAKLAAATALGQIAHGLITDRLPQPWRRLWQLGSLVYEGGIVASNHGAKVPWVVWPSG